jgi:hypothetical protein
MIYERDAVLAQAPDGAVEVGDFECHVVDHASWPRAAAQTPA